MSEATVRFADGLLQEGFTQVPNVLLRDRSLSAGARLTWTLLASYAWKDATVFPGQVVVAEELGVSDRMLRTYISELVDSEWLEVEQRGLGKTNVYTLYFRSRPEACFRLDRKPASGQERKPTSGPTDEADEVEEDEVEEHGALFDSPDQTRLLWDFYRQHVPDGQKQLTPERRRELKSALKARDLDTCKRAVEWLGRSPHHNGQNDTGGKYLELKYAIGKVRQSEAIGDRIDSMAKHVGRLGAHGTTTVAELMATVPSGGHEIVELRMERVRAMFDLPDSEVAQSAGREALRLLREAPPRCEPIVTDGKIAGWRRAS